MAAGLCRFNTAARGGHQADVRIFQEVRKPLLLSQVVALGLAQALRDIAVDEVARTHTHTHTPRITTLQPLATPELDPGGGGGAPSPRSSAAPRLRKEASTTNHLSESIQHTAFLTLMVQKNKAPNDRGRRLARCPDRVVRSTGNKLGVQSLPGGMSRVKRSPETLWENSKARQHVL